MRSSTRRGACRYDDAVEWAEGSLRSQPNYASACALRPQVMRWRGGLGSAAIDGPTMRVHPVLRLSNLAEVLPPFYRPDDRSRYIAGLRKAGLPD